ncbi:MAG TPA: hypothetical protein PL101_05085, partial [Bacteroidales bacterium]|nr:hypothetical protein [Bacteroidales bacterium]
MRYATLIILVFINSLLKAADYYVSSTGNDLNSGLGISSAWRTIDKVNSIFSSLNPGDRILFKCG